MKKLLTGVMVVGMMALSGGVSAEEVEKRLYINNQGMEVVSEGFEVMSWPNIVKLNGLRYTRRETSPGIGGPWSFVSYYSVEQDLTVLFMTGQNYLQVYKGHTGGFWARTLQQNDLSHSSVYFYQGTL